MPILSLPRAILVRHRVFGLVFHSCAALLAGVLVLAPLLPLRLPQGLDPWQYPLWYVVLALLISLPSFLLELDNIVAALGKLRFRATVATDFVPILIVLSYLVGAISIIRMLLSDFFAIEMLGFLPMAFVYHLMALPAFRVALSDSGDADSRVTLHLRRAAIWLQEGKLRTLALMGSFALLVYLVAAIAHGSLFAGDWALLSLFFFLIPYVSRLDERALRTQRERRSAPRTLWIAGPRVFADEVVLAGITFGKWDQGRILACAREAAAKMDLKWHSPGTDKADELTIQGESTSRAMFFVQKGKRYHILFCSESEHLALGINPLEKLLIREKKALADWNTGNRNVWLWERHNAHAAWKPIAVFAVATEIHHAVVDSARYLVESGYTLESGASFEFEGISVRKTTELPAHTTLNLDASESRQRIMESAKALERSRSPREVLLVAGAGAYMTFFAILAVWMYPGPLVPIATVFGGLMPIVFTRLKSTIRIGAALAAMACFATSCSNADVVARNSEQSLVDLGKRSIVALFENRLVVGTPNRDYYFSLSSDFARDERDIQIGMSAEDFVAAGLNPHLLNESPLPGVHVVFDAYNSSLIFVIDLSDKVFSYEQSSASGGPLSFIDIYKAFLGRERERLSWIKQHNEYFLDFGNGFGVGWNKDAKGAFGMHFRIPLNLMTASGLDKTKLHTWTASMEGSLPTLELVVPL